MESFEIYLTNCVKRASRSLRPTFTRFLDPAQQQTCIEAAAKAGIAVRFYGGYPDAERAVACFCSPEDEIAEEEYPICLIASRLNMKFASISHRDLLGAYMALGLTREAVGDMIMGDGQVFVFAVESLAPAICEQFISAGKVPLSFSVQAQIPRMPEPKGSYFTAQVSSLRFDAVLAAAYSVSRSDAADCIRAGAAKLNHIPCERTDAQVGAGAMLSLRGKGRVRVVSLDGLTRKQKQNITCFRYE